MTPGEQFIVRLSDHLDALVCLNDVLDVTVEFRGIGGTEPMPYLSLTLEELRRVLSFADFHSTGGQR